MKSSEIFIAKKLAERKLAGNYRSLKTTSDLVDFCSNDYLGFGRSSTLKEKTIQEISENNLFLNGSTGSRLLSGNSVYAEDLEAELANLYGFKSGLLFNSGYDANLGLFSSVLQRGDTIITDELIHASIIDGARLSYANRYSFKHNDLNSLEDKLKHAKGNCYVAIESIYSMDGDAAPIEDILYLTNKYNASLIVDEAHATGLYNLGLINETLSDRIFTKIVTFGKALGSHGAIVLGSEQLKEYLVNFARSFIFTTAPSYHQLATISQAHKLLNSAEEEISRLRENIVSFKDKLVDNNLYTVIKSNSAIQCILFGSNESAKEMAALLQQNGLDVRAILSPTVAAGQERIRICLHSFNTEKEIILLTEILNNYTNGR